tara:strand:+ start:458 stop:685 length:228 start_codon:yes stop_codon:yes gene_type:complete
MVCRGGTTSQQPLQADPRASPPCEVGLLSDWFAGCVLNVHLEMVLKILTDAWQLVMNRDPRRLQEAFRAYSTQLQ